MLERRCALALALLLSACAAPSVPLLPEAAPEAGPFGVSAARRGASVSFFVGMDDYNEASTLPGIQALHRQLAAAPAGPELALLLAADSDVKQDGFRARVTPGQAWGQGFEPLGELQTNRTPDLRNFLAWAGRQAPAERAHVVVNTHGGAYRGVLLDYDGKSGDPAKPTEGLTLQRTVKALAKGFAGGRIDSLTFDACMMATIEAGEALKGTVAVMTGSEDFSMGGSPPWERILAPLATNPRMGGAAFGKTLSAEIVQHGRWGDRGSLTWSAIALDQPFDRLVKEVDRLAGALLVAMETEPDAVRRAASATRPFAIMARYADHYGDFGQRDLVEFCEALETHVKSGPVREDAGRVKAAVAATLVAFEKHPSETMAHGLAIYLPTALKPASRERALAAYEATAFGRHTRWDSFLRALNP